MEVVGDIFQKGEFLQARIELLQIKEVEGGFFSEEELSSQEGVTWNLAISRIFVETEITPYLFERR